MNNDVTILVNSCDLYEDAWYPFFKLLQIQWPSCDCDIVLNTETKPYSCDFLKVKTICSGKGTWSQRLLKCLDQIATEYILFFLEDQFLREPVNTEYWQKSVSYMKEHNDTGVIFLRHTEKQKDDYHEDYFPRDYLTDNFRIVGMVALYRKAYLKSILRKHENPWEFELYASIRSKRRKESVLQYSAYKPAIFVYDDAIEKGYGITRKKWLRKNRELFEQYGITVNFENLGFYDPGEVSVPKSKESLAKKSSDVVESCYRIKKGIKKLPGNVKSTIRKIRSLI